MNREQQLMAQLTSSKTTSVVLAEHEDQNIFAFFVRFPSTKRIIQVQSTPLTENQYVAPDAYKKFTDKVVERLLVSNDQTSISETNWVSVMACIQRLITDWNAKRAKALAEARSILQVH